MKRTIGPLIVALAVAMLSGACASSGDAGSSKMMLLPKGEVTLLRAGEEPITVTEELEIEPGVGIATGLTGQAVVTMPGTTLELAKSSAIRMEETPRVLSGSLLSVNEPPFSLVAGASTIEASAGTAMRVDTGLTNPRLAVYQGEATLPGSGIEAVGALKQVILVEGQVSYAPEPMSVDPKHAWDRRFFADAVELFLDLTQFRNGLLPQVRGARDKQALIAAFPKIFLERQVKALLKDNQGLISPVELLVAAQVAAVADKRSDLSAMQLLNDIVELRRDGGLTTWIVIIAQLQASLDQGGLISSLAKLSGVVAEALVPDVVAPPAATSSSSAGNGSSSSSSDGGSGDPPPGDGTSDPQPQPDPQPDPQPKPETKPKPKPEPNPENPENPENPDTPTCADGDLVCGAIDEPPVPPTDTPAGTPPV